MLKALSLFLVFILFACSDESLDTQTDDDKQVRDLTVEEQKIVQSNKNFGVSLFKEINNLEEDGKNIFISPLSVSMALGMTLNGAATTTYDAMQSRLQFNSMTNEEINSAYQTLIELLQTVDDQVLFEIANSIWYREGFNVEQDFLNVNQSYFDAEVQAADFDDPATVDIINDWVSLNTHQKIQTIIEEISPETVMFLINAIYFNGTWKYAFDSDATKDDLFYLANGNTSSAQMMNISANFDYYKDQDVQIVDLPYGDNKFSMTLFLPTSAVDDFISGLSNTKLESYLNQLTPDSGNVYLPKIKISYELLLNDVLINLGMGIAFSPGQADFSRINSLESLFISFVLHKTFVQVDEQGTEAAAVTIVVIDRTSVDPHGSPFTIYMNRPYFFIIREKNTEAILFMGKIMNPLWEE